MSVNFHFDVQFVCVVHRNNTTTIYPLLDWSKPGKSIVVSATGILFVFVIHFGVYCLYRFRVCVFSKLCLGRNNNDDDELGAHKDRAAVEQTKRIQHNPNTICELKM